MTVSSDEIKNLAMLARIGLNPVEQEEMRVQLDQILLHVSQLSKIDTSQVLATAQIGDAVNVWREDACQESLTAEQALANAPNRQGNFFVVGAIQENRQRGNGHLLRG